MRASLRARAYAIQRSCILMQLHTINLIVKRRSLALRSRRVENAKMKRPSAHATAFLARSSQSRTGGDPPGILYTLGRACDFARFKYLHISLNTADAI